MLTGSRELRHVCPHQQAVALDRLCLEERGLSSPEMFAHAAGGEPVVAKSCKNQHQPEADLDALDAVPDAAAVASRCGALPAHDERHTRRAAPLRQRPQPDGGRVARQVVEPLLAGRPAGQVMIPAAESGFGCGLGWGLGEG